LEEIILETHRTEAGELFSYPDMQCLESRRDDNNFGTENSSILFPDLQSVSEYGI
jgi:hypothetical protein